MEYLFIVNLILVAVSGFIAGHAYAKNLGSFAVSINLFATIFNILAVIYLVS